MKHTQGKWQVDKNNLMFGYSVSNGKKVVATIPAENAYDDEEARANAELIASLPDIIEAAMEE